MNALISGQYDTEVEQLVAKYAEGPVPWRFEKKKVNPAVRKIGNSFSRLMTRFAVSANRRTVHAGDIFVP